MTTCPPRLCLVEDDEIMGESLCDRFQLDGFACDWHKTAASAMACLGKTDYAVAISDIRLPDLSGDEMFSRMIATRTALPPFIFITGYGAIDTAVKLLKQGAADFITKPFDLDALMEIIRTQVQVASAKPPGSEQPSLGVSAPMRRIAGMLPRLAQHASTILITGEVRRRQGEGCVGGAPMQPQRRQCGPSSPSIVERFPKICLRPNCSATRKAPSPAPSGPGRASSSRRMAGFCSWTKSATCRWRCRSSCCAPYKSAASCALAGRRPYRWNSA